MLPNKNSGRMVVKIVIVLVLLAGAAFFVVTSAQKRALVKVAKTDTAVDAVTGSVTVDADGGTQKELKAEADGKVVECDKIFDGAIFKKNDVLLRLDTVELDRRIAEFKRSYANGKHLAQMELTGGKPELLANVDKLSDVDRAKLYREVSQSRTLAAEALRKAQRMFELNSVSEEELKTARRTLENIDTGLAIRAFNDRKAEDDYAAQLKNYDIELERMIIRAPSDGEITQAMIWEGALIGRGTMVAKFMSHARIVTAKISEENFGKVRIGQKAKVRLLTYGETSFDAVVSKTLPRADEAQRFTVYLDVKVEKQDMLKPNSTGEVTITVDQHPNATVIPRVALFDYDKIFAVKNGRAEKRQVKTGYVNLTEAEILQGIAPGEQVIVDMLQRFRDGDRVRAEVLP